MQSVKALFKQFDKEEAIVKIIDIPINVSTVEKLKSVWRETIGGEWSEKFPDDAICIHVQFKISDEWKMISTDQDVALAIGLAAIGSSVNPNGEYVISFLFEVDQKGNQIDVSKNDSVVRCIPAIEKGIPVMFSYITKKHASISKMLTVDKKCNVREFIDSIVAFQLDINISNPGASLQSLYRTRALQVNMTFPHETDITGLIVSNENNKSITFGDIITEPMDSLRVEFSEQKQTSSDPSNNTGNKEECCFETHIARDGTIIQIETTPSELSKFCTHNGQKFYDQRLKSMGTVIGVTYDVHKISVWVLLEKDCKNIGGDTVKRASNYEMKSGDTFFCRNNLIATDQELPYDSVNKHLFYLSKISDTGLSFDANGMISDLDSGKDFEHIVQSMLT